MVRERPALPGSLSVNRRQLRCARHAGLSFHARGDYAAAVAVRGSRERLMLWDCRGDSRAGCQAPRHGVALQRCRWRCVVDVAAGFERPDKPVAALFRRPAKLMVGYIGAKPAGCCRAMKVNSFRSVLPTVRTQLAGGDRFTYSETQAISCSTRWSRPSEIAQNNPAARCCHAP